MTMPFIPHTTCKPSRIKITNLDDAKRAMEQAVKVVEQSRKAEQPIPAHEQPIPAPDWPVRKPISNPVSKAKAR